jgi:hypothetical protein
MADLIGHLLPCCRHGHPAVVMAGPDRPSLPPGRHFWLFLLDGRSFLSARPSLSAVFVGLAVNFSRQAIIICHFCWLDGCHGRPRPAISAAGPSFLPIFAGSAVVFVRRAITFGLFCRLGGHFCPPGHHFLPFLLARRLSWPAPTGHLLPAVTLFLRSAGGNGAGPVAGRRNSSFYGPGLRPGP